MIKEKTIVPRTIWITGISASGKTTLSRWLINSLQDRGIDNIEIFDGEIVRGNLNKKYTYSLEDRYSVTLEIAKLASASNKQGNIAIVAAISHLKKARDQARQIIGGFMEVYLKCPVETCAKRDYKGHYKKAIAGEYEDFIGITSPYDVSENPELILDTANNSIEICGEILLDYSLKFLYGIDVNYTCEESYVEK